MHHENCGTGSNTADKLFAAAGLSSSELTRLSEVLGELEHMQAESPYAVAAVRLLILTGCRVGEILKLRWQDVDFEGGCLRLPDSKTGPKTVDLNAPALELLSETDRLEESEHVLPGLQLAQQPVGTHPATSRS